MNYSPISARLSYKTNPGLGGVLPYNGPLDIPQFEKNPEDNLRTRFIDKQDPVRTAMKGEYYGAGDCGDNVNEVVRLFFSAENIKRIQKLIRQEVYIKTEKQFVLNTDQDEQDLLIAMRAIVLEEARFLPFKLVHQVKVLNRKLIDAITPDVLSAVRQAYSYQKEISRPINPIPRALCCTNAGRKTLPSISSVWGF